MTCLDSYRDAKQPQTGDCAVAILAGSEVGNAGISFSDRTQHCKSVGNGFIAGQLHTSGEFGAGSNADVHGLIW
jgi:hypothetical protein